MKRCLNCGAEVEEVDDLLRHKRSHAIACDLDDPSSLNAEIAD